MKHLIHLIIISAASALLLSSCEKIEHLYSRAFGSEVVFGYSTQRGTATKASYSGSKDSNGYERIEWVAGDKVGIYCAQASDPKPSLYHEYFVKSGSGYITNSGKSSSAKLDHDPETTGLRWGDEGVLHKFTALYPAPSVISDISEGSVKCSLPAVQTYGTKTETSGNIVCSPNPAYIFLAGYGEATAGGSSTPVNLYFDPAVTTFQITLTNAYPDSKAMSIASLGITTTNTTSGNENLVGAYTVDVTGIALADASTLDTGDIAKTALTGPTASMTFSPELSLANGKALTFTLFVQPGNDITNLSFWMKDHDGYTRRFAFKMDGTWVNFPAFHKAEISGLATPESVGWTISFSPSVVSWNSDTASSSDVNAESGNLMTFISPTLTDWNTVDKGGITYCD